jgi:DNA-binding GntR family transcriptional regulator
MPIMVTLGKSTDKSSTDIATDIANAIVTGQLPPGTKLKEEALAKLFAVSRTKIRAALVMLAKDELIETAPDKGASVSRLSPQEAQEIFAVRRILEAALIREFVKKATAADYLRIDAHMERERNALAAHDVRQRAKLLGEFHTLLADIVGNQVLLGILKKLTARGALAAMQHQSDQEASCSSDEHMQIIEAAKAGNVERAVELTMHHLRHVEQMIEDEKDIPLAANDLVAALLVS